MTTIDQPITADKAADAAVKAKHRAMWASGDYPVLARDLIADLGPALVEACGVRPGMRVLDVAAGAGNAALVAADAAADVVAADLTPELFAAGRAAAAERGVEVTWREADAEALPFADAAFDVVMSCVGVMFAPHHQQAADELVRVCRPGGTIGLLNWSPGGFIGQMFDTMKPYAPPPPPGAQPPPLWGREDHVRSLLAGRVAGISAQRKILRVSLFSSPEDFRDYFKARYGPVIAVYRSIAGDPVKTAALDHDLAELARRHDRGAGAMDWEYLLLTVRKPAGHLLLPGADEGHGAMAGQRDACSKPCVLVRSGRSAPIRAGASAADEVYSFWGYTPHFEIYIAESLLGIAVPLAEAIKETCEDDYGRLRHHFGGLTPGNLPFRIYVTPGREGARHSGCGDTGLYCDAFDANDGVLMRYLVVAEADEVFMDSQGRGWLCDCSNGEGLSRVLATDAYPDVSGFFTAGCWLNSPRTDFVSQVDESDGNPDSTGCSALFLYYLKSQLGFSWPQIVQAGAYLPLDKQFPSLANTYANLTGHTDAFDSFYSLVTRRFPYGVQAELPTDNPFPIKPDLLFYARSAGIGQLYATDLAGDIGLLNTYTDWRTTWTMIVPMHFSRTRHSDVLFYNANAGLGELYSTNGLGELNPIVRRYTNWRTSWSIIVAGSFTGTGFSDLLFYDPAGGIGEFYRVDKEGGLTLLASHTDWLTTWSQIVAGNFSRSDSTDLLFYEPAAGVLECWTVDGYGNVAFLNSTPTSHTWSIILPLNATGTPFSDLLLYDAVQGTGELVTSDGEGGLRHVRSFTGWRTNWSVILSPSFGQLLFYSAESGVAQSYEIDPQGTMTLRRTYEDWRTDWSLIHTGNFADHI